MSFAYLRPLLRMSFSLSLWARTVSIVGWWVGTCSTDGSGWCRLTCMARPRMRRVAFALPQLAYDSSNWSTMLAYTTIVPILNDRAIPLCYLIVHYISHGRSNNYGNKLDHTISIMMQHYSDSGLRVTVVVWKLSFSHNPISNSCIRNSIWND